MKLKEDDLFPYLHRYAIAALKFRDKSALSILQEVLNLHKENSSYSNDLHGRLLILAASEARQRGRPKKAYEFLGKAKKLAAANNSEAQTLGALIDLEFSYLHFEKGDIARAARFNDQAYTVLTDERSEISPLQLAYAELLRGDIYLRQQNWAQAIPHFETAYNIYKTDSLNFTKLNGEHNVTAAYILKRLVAAYHNQGDTAGAEATALEFAYTRPWEAGYLIYNPTEKIPFWLSESLSAKKEKQAAGYIASYEMTAAGRRKNIEIHIAKNISAEEVQLQFEQSYYVPKIENGKPVAERGCKECQFHVRH
ncbi:tetratricopeptide repeat protein [Kordiimonas sp. SCSIO 12603]|uniref:tetratricopeptide repeat protein n=1 Tax=Kordiimonas sp. SCSIO 12603 TaxID=2829596 RepID=UPI0021067CC2|nr:tetratricopeptide repeat protein [Kordiimonas sp. SCSIO 12603]UTW57953.1 tetratricopeptide repeat protein [Kordiimonas sp. SCSIO 12603]